VGWTALVPGDCCGRSSSTASGTARSRRPRRSPRSRRWSAVWTPAGGITPRSTRQAWTPRRPRSARSSTSSRWEPPSCRPRRRSCATAPPRICAPSTSPPAA